MEAYKKNVRVRVIALSLAAIAAAAILAFGIITGRMTPQPDSGEAFDFGNYFAGFQAGAIGALVVAFAILAIKLGLVLSSPAKLKARYIAENDERSIFIHRSSGGFMLHACAVVILLAASVAGYYDQAVFFSLLGCAVFLMVVKNIAKLYFSKKY